jgi:hypothetical protein
MGQGPEELRRDIERRRDDLGATIDVIGDHISPGRIIERRRNRVVNGWRGVKDRVMGVMDSGTSRVGDAAGSVRDQVSSDTLKQQTAGAPLVAGVIAFGVGFLVAAVIPASEPETHAAQRLQDQLEPATDALKESGQHLAAAVKDDAAAHASEVKDTASDAAGTVTDTAKEHAQATKDDATQIRR